MAANSGDLFVPCSIRSAVDVIVFPDQHEIVTIDDGEISNCDSPHSPFRYRETAIRESGLGRGSGSDQNHFLGWLL